VLPRQRGQVFRVQRDQGGEKRLSVAIHHHMLQNRHGFGRGLDGRRRNVFAAGGDDEVFFAAGDVQIPVGVQPAEITGV